QRLRRLKEDVAGLLLDRLSVGGGGALRPGIDRTPPQFRRLRQTDSGFRLFEREGPAVAGRVPIELIIAGEATDLAHSPVVKYVAVLADIDVFLRIADLDPDSVAERLRLRRNRYSIKRCAFEREADADLAPMSAAVARREVAVDAVFDLAVLGAKVDRFSDLESAV